MNQLTSVEEQAIQQVHGILWRAIEMLATGTGPIQERLLSPVLLLTGSIPELESLPQDAQRELREIRHALLSKCMEDECGRIVARILALYRRLTPDR